MKEVLFVINEAGQIGHMECIDQGLTLLRGYGLRMAFFVQSLGQIKETFAGKEAILLDNTEQIYFGVKSLETAERMSKMLGDETITVESANAGQSWSKQQGGEQNKGGVNYSRSSGRNWSVQARALLQPAEVLHKLSGDYLIAFIRGVPPIMCRRIKWYEEVVFGGTPPRPPLFWWCLVLLALALVAWAMSAP